MATDYPGAVDGSSKLPNPSTGSFTNNPSHAGLHDNVNDAIKAAQTKLGTGSSVPAANTFLIGDGAGSSSWTQLTSAQLAARLSDETGSSGGGLAVFSNTPSLTTPKMDTINEVTPANGVTIDGLNIKDNKLNTNNSVVSSNITAASVTPDKLGLGGASAYVATSETTTSTSYTDLATTSDSVTITVGANGLALVSLYAAMGNNTTNSYSWATFAASGANTIAASDIYGIQYQAFAANAGGRFGATHLLTGLTPGSTTFKMKYKIQVASTGTFLDRRILAIPL